MAHDSCRLCGRVSQLQESHIIPKFVFRWLKETSATGHLRFSQNPNLRSQDGLKELFLCKECERRFSAWETEFSKKVFYPLTRDADASVYDDWMIRFCTCVSWRILKWYLENDQISHVKTSLMHNVEQCELNWRRFLLGDSHDIGKYEQHFLPLGPLESHTYVEMPTNMNRYLLRAVDMDIISSEEIVLVYAKIGPFIILGFVEVPYPDQWVGTKIQQFHGEIGPRDYTLPSEFGEFLKQKADRMANANAQISDRQQAKIAQAYRKDIDKAANSESFKAMDHDVRLFGSRAFKK